eukprot:Pgem_evm1s3227
MKTVFAFAAIVATSAMAQEYEMKWRNSDGSMSCLSVDNNEFKNGQTMQTWECEQSSGQLFTFGFNSQEGAYDGSIRVAAAPQYCVVIDSNSASTGARIQLWDCDNAEVQQWKTGSTNHGLAIMNKQTYTYMAPHNTYAQDGTGVVTTSGSSTNDQWQMVSINNNCIPLGQPCVNSAQCCNDPSGTQGQCQLLPGSTRVMTCISP